MELQNFKSSYFWLVTAVRERYLPDCPREKIDLNVCTHIQSAYCADDKGKGTIPVGPSDTNNMPHIPRYFTLI